MIKEIHNPDVLNCLANLSSDEVFTSPKIVNQMLDMLPQELFCNKDTKFLEPCSKSGVFLREIAKRLIEGLKNEIPNLEERINHILTKQLYGIAITKLTALLTRRSLYCSKSANGKYSIADKFSNEIVNIKFNNIRHSWNEDFRCEFCGVGQSKNTYNRSDMEVHAYEFIHTHNPEELFNMKFDVIVGNPPYQLNVGNTSGNSAKAKDIYHLFVSQAIKMKPRFLTMIIPSRWMTRSTEGISDEWVDEIINSQNMRIMHDFLDASICFPGVEIKGGVCYFLWDRDNCGDCSYYLHNSNDFVTSRIGKLDFLNA
ncbi:MAG: Eco57I restriction-modification methylase domain-containing protein, partial [Clostridia bacterium]|nr:Eco57I restriction-modification methylase domain-containing protein [Clostridia bacterium]